LKVPQDSLGSNKVSFSGIMHVETDLLDSISDVRPSEGHVLQSTGKTAISCRICNWRAGVSRDLGTGVNRGCARITVTHTMAAENVQGVLPLGEEQVGLMALNSNFKEEVERTKVFHGKFLLQGCNNTVK
jgi:hypothetical protein